jgi:hypothetical protein
MSGAALTWSGGMTFSKSARGGCLLAGSHGYTGASTVWDGALVVNGPLAGLPVTTGPSIRIHAAGPFQLDSKSNPKG